MSDKPLCLFSSAELEVGITGYWLGEIMDGKAPVSHPISYWLNADPPEDAADNPSAIRRACRKALDNGFAVWRISESPRLEMFLLREPAQPERSPLYSRAITRSATVDAILVEAQEHAPTPSPLYNKLEALRTELIARGISECGVIYHV